MLSAIPNWLFVVNGFSIVIDLIMVAGVFFASRTLERQYRKTAFWGLILFIGTWQLLATMLARQGIFVPVEGKFNPILLVLLAGLFCSYFLFTKWKVFKILLSSLPLSWIVIIQFFRILGGSFLVLFYQKLLPPQFALPAGIGDVFIGLSALFVAWALHNKKTWSPTITRWWCYLGILDLIIAVTMGAVTSPSNLQNLMSLPLKPTNFLIGEYPLVMIPIFRVPFAITLHLLVLRTLNKQQLTMDKKQSKQNQETLISPQNLGHILHS